MSPKLRIEESKDHILPKCIALQVRCLLLLYNFYKAIIDHLLTQDSSFQIIQWLAATLINKLKTIFTLKVSRKPLLATPLSSFRK